MSYQSDESIYPAENKERERCSSKCRVHLRLKRVLDCGFYTLFDRLRKLAATK